MKVLEEKPMFWPKPMAGAVAKIDVLIPAYNVGPTIIESVESILNQSFRDIRVVVVDDGSTDDTPQKLAALAARDPRLCVHRQQNSGIVDALNNGLKFCSAEFIARHDGDDVAFSDRLEKQLSYLEANPDCVAVGANAHHIDAGGRRTGGRTRMKDPAWADASRVPADEPYLMHPLLLIRRESILKVGAYRYVFHAEDADLYWRLRSAGRLHNLEELLAEYRIHPNSISGKSVVNGRIQAVTSQLAALSERRRAGGANDLEFPRDALTKYHDARSIGRMTKIAEEALRHDEMPQFRLAVAAKLLELESYRPYELEAGDRLYIKDAFRQYSSLLSKDDRYLARKHWAKYLGRLARERKLGAAVEMFTWSVVPLFASLTFNFVMRRLFKAWKG